jgi:hypothetical protein
MDFDIRFPIGLVFVAIGSLLALHGLFADPRIFERSLGVNVNLGWGIVLALFGAALLALAIMSRRGGRDG